MLDIFYSLSVQSLVHTFLLLFLFQYFLNACMHALIVDYKWFVFFLALVPGIWEELAFRGVVLSNLQQKYSPKMSVLTSAILFGLFHFSNLVKDDLTTVIFFVIMATAFGIGWGYIAIKSNSVLPAIFIHYAVDVILIGPLFTDVGLATDVSISLFFISLTILFPIVCVVFARILSRKEALE